MSILAWIFAYNILDLANSAKSLGSEQYLAQNGTSASSSQMQGVLVNVNSDGSPSAYSSSSTPSCVVSLGCYLPREGYTPPLTNTASKTAIHPLECFKICDLQKLKVAAVNGPNCSCSLQILPHFAKAISESHCSNECSPGLCGGGDEYWNLFMCYTYEQLNTLAVDPWRGIAFKSVSVNWFVEDGIPYNTTISPIETHFLFACDISSGTPMVQYHMQESEGAIMGLQFDVDSSRLVGIVLTPLTFSYKLAIITIDTSLIGYPRVVPNFYTIYLDPVTRRDIFGEGGTESRDFALGSIVSGIVSKSGIDTFIFTIPYGGASAYMLSSKLIFIDLSNPSIGQVFYSAPMDCIVSQIAVNQYYGDVGALCARQGSVQFVAIASVYRNSQLQIRVHAYWDPSGGQNPVLIVPVTETQNLNLLAGVSVSISMMNQSCHGIMLYNPLNGAKYTSDMQLLMNQPTESNSGGVPSVVCFDIRNSSFLQLWGSSNGTARTVENGQVQTPITMNLFSTDPGFPMTLARPEIFNCILSLTGTQVRVKFDTVTLMGASPVDTNRDGIPDKLDPTTAITSSANPAPASECFSDASLPLLIGATCYFSQGDTMILTLDRRLSTLTYSNSLCIKPNFLARASPDQTQWSSFATSCCQVTLPAIIPPPTPVMSITPSSVVDVCSDVSIDLTDSSNCGRGCTYFWTIVNVTMTSGNSAAGGGSGVTFADGIIRRFLIPINEAKSMSSIRIPSSILMKNSIHNFQVTLTSSWTQKTLHAFSITKLGASAPTVVITTPTTGNRLIQKQSESYSITAIGQISTCDDNQISPSSGIGYLWKYTNCSVSLSAGGSVVNNQNSITIPIGTHKCSPTIAWRDGDQVACEMCIATVTAFLQGIPSTTTNATQSVLVEIVKSPIQAKCLNPDLSDVSIGEPLIVNCAETFDPDATTSGTSSGNFQGDFFFKCMHLNPQTGVTDTCFSNPIWSSTTLVGMPTCVTDYSQGRLVGEGGVMYPQVLFNTSQPPYCRLGRGVVAINTLEVGDGIKEINILIDIVHYDKIRTASKNIRVKIHNFPVPKLSIQIVNGAHVNKKYAITSGLQFVTNVAVPDTMSSQTAAEFQYSWSLAEKQLNREYDPDLAALYSAKGLQYSIPQYMYVPVQLLVECQSANKAKFFSNSTTLTLAPSCLLFNREYSLGMTVSWPSTSGTLNSTSEIKFATAGGPPRGGQLAVVGDGTCDSMRTLIASDWVSEDIPLMYRFGYLVDVGKIVTKFWLTDTLQQARSISSLIPCGVASEGFMRIILVQITSSFGESAIVYLPIISRPPVDVAKSVTSLLAQGNMAVNSNPNEAFSKYHAALSLIHAVPSSENSQTSFAALVESVGKAPCATSECGDKQVVLLNQIVSLAKGPKSLDLIDTILTAVESNTARITAGGSQAAATSASVMGAKSQNIMGTLSTLLAGLMEVNVTMATEKVATRQLQASLRLDLSEQVRDSNTYSWTRILSDCVSTHCSFPGTVCMKSLNFGAMIRLTCCDAVSAVCSEPPCWFERSGCDGLIPGPTSVRLDTRADKSLEDRTLSDLVTMEAKEIEASWGVYESQLFNASTELEEDQLFAEYLSGLSTVIQTQLWSQRNASKAASQENIRSKLFATSRIVDRINSARDKIVDSVIGTLIRNDPPIIYDTPLFRVTIGKSTDLFSASEKFSLPESQFKVPVNSPDSPTSNNPVTAFSYQFVEYHDDVYSWAKFGRPPSSNSQIFTLSVKRANSENPLVLSPLETEPLKIFLQNNFSFSNSICMLWDRLLDDGAGGWSTEGIVNDGGDHCLVTRTGTVGVFTDIIPVTNLYLKTSDSTGTVPGLILGYIAPSSLYILVTFGMSFIILLTFALWGLRLDIIGTDIAYFLQGDGLIGASTIDDPIAYPRATDIDQRWFVWYTFLSVVRMHHFVFAPFRSHPHIQRFDRVILVWVLMAGIMASSIGMIAMEGFQIDPGSVGFTGAVGSYVVYHVVRRMIFSISDSPLSVKQIIGFNAPIPNTPPTMSSRRHLVGLPNQQSTARSVSARKNDEIDVTFSQLFPVVPFDFSKRPRVPPLPIEENTSGFIHRVRQVYNDRTQTEHEKEILSHIQPVIKIAPHWVRKILRILKYVSISLWSVTMSILMLSRILWLGGGASPARTSVEQIWFESVGLAIISVMIIFDPIFCGVLTLKELRAFENRRQMVLVPRRRVAEKDVQFMSPFPSPRIVTTQQPTIRGRSQPPIAPPSAPPPSGTTSVKSSPRSASWSSTSDFAKPPGWFVSEAPTPLEDLLPGRLLKIGPPTSPPPSIY